MHQFVSSRSVITRLPLLLLMLISLGGCASSSVFKPYPVQMQPIKQQVSNGNFDAAQKTLDGYRDDPDRILYLMERGRVSQIANDIPASIEDFRQVIRAMEINEDKARVTLTGSTAKGTSLLTNDNAIPYTGEAYERIFVHQFQALNYLLQNNLEAALVEVRRANQQQALALEAHDKEVARVEEELRDTQSSGQDVMRNFQAMAEMAAKVKNSFQNAYSFYTSGLIYEVSGELNDAYIDYKKALEIAPDSRVLRADVLRLARRLGMQDDLQFYRQRYAVDLEQLEQRAVQRGEGEIVVLYEQGFAPVKMETGITLPISGHLMSVAFPYYPGVWVSDIPLTVEISGADHVGRTETVVSVQALAAKALEEDMPGIMLRQILRLAAKREIGEQTGKRAGDGARLIVEIFNAITESADRRSWLTLPANAQILRHALAPGEYQLYLGGDKVSVRVDADRKTLIHVIETGGRLHTQVRVL